MKKLLTLLLLLSVCASGFAACAGDGGQSTETSQTSGSAAETEPPVTAATISSPQTPAESVADMKSVVNIPSANSKPAVTAAASLEKSAQPNITLTMHNENRKLLVGGKCDVGAVIYIRGGLKDMTYGTKDGNFMGVAELPEEGTVNITVTQKAPGKAESEPITITTQARTDVNLVQKKGAYHEIIGDNYRSYVVDEVADFTGTNLYSDSQKTTVKERIASNVEYLKSVNPDAEIIYLLVPTEMHVYPESVPEEYKQFTDDSRTAQFTEAAREAGAVVIDLYDTFHSLRDNGKYNLFHNTDTHWTYYGAYLGCRELMDYISEKWPDAKLRDESEYGFYNKEVACGDLGEHLMIDNSLLKETTTFFEPKFSIVANPDIYKTGRCELYHNNTQKEQTVTNTRTDLDLPTAMLIRDSFGSPAFGIFSDAFAETYWRAMWDYNFNKSSIEKNKPDYIVYVVAERNIKSIVR